MVFFFNTLNAQSYYRMETSVTLEGFYDWIANLKLQGANVPLGIAFTAGSNCRGFVTRNGTWGFPKRTGIVNLPKFINYIQGLDNSTMGVQGKLYAEQISVGDFYNPRVSLELYARDGYTNINTSGDNNGLVIRSNTGKKIYLYDKVYWNNKAWVNMGPGRNDDPTINNNNSCWLRIGGNSGIAFWGKPGAETNDNPDLLIKNGNVDIKGDVYIRISDSIRLALSSSADSPNESWFGTSTNSGIHFGTNGISLLYLGTDHNLYVGLSHKDIPHIRPELRNKYRLFVKEGILSEDYAIAPIASWADFVFHKNYNLRPLSEVEKFIKDKKHLPDVPSAQKVAEDGYSQHEMNKVLLQKVEELTLYVIELEKQVKSLKDKE